MDSMEECDGVGYDEGIIGQGFVPIVWDLVCIAEVASARHVERWSTEIGSSLLQKEQFSGWRCETR